MSKSVPCQKFGDFCEVVEKLTYNSSLRYKRRLFKNVRENYIMEQMFFRATSVAILLVQVSENKNKNKRSQKITNL